MKIRSIVRGCAVVVALACALSVAPTPASAQSVSLPPAIQSKINAWFKWMADHKSLIRLGDLLSQVGEMDRDPRTSFDKKQSAQMLAIIRKWGSKPSMSDEDAKTVQKEIGAILTIKQVQKVATIEAPSQKMMKAGMANQKSGATAKMDASKIPDPPSTPWNPLNPSTMPFAQARAPMKKIMSDWEASLTKRAKG